jgi:hypothetical protein
MSNRSVADGAGTADEDEASARDGVGVPTVAASGVEARLLACGTSRPASDPRLVDAAGATVATVNQAPRAANQIETAIRASVLAITRDRVERREANGVAFALIGGPVAAAGSSMPSAWAAVRITEPSIVRWRAA